MSCVKLLHKALDRSTINVDVSKSIWAFFVGLAVVIGAITALVKVFVQPYEYTEPQVVVAEAEQTDVPDFPLEDPEESGVPEERIPEIIAPPLLEAPVEAAGEDA